MGSCDEDKCRSCPAQEGCESARRAIGVTVMMRQLLHPNEEIEVSKEKAIDSFFKFMDLKKKAREEGRELGMDEFNPLED